MFHLLVLLYQVSMYLVLNSLITITPVDGPVFKIRSIQDVRIKSSWKNLTSTCEITLPRAYKVENRNRDIRDFLTAGTAIEVQLGYNGDLQTEFSGYVTGFDGSGPITIDCEDEMWRLKRTNLNKVFYKSKLRDLIEFVVPEYQTEIEEVSIGDFEIRNATAAQVLKEFSEHPYNMFSYFPLGSKVLHVGFPYRFKSSNRHILHLQRNTKNESLEYRNIEADQIQVRVISHLDNGQILETLHPKNLDGASQRTLNVMNVETVQELEAYAKAELDRFNFSGYEGNITSFGIPVVRHGDEVDIRDARYPERNGVYLIDEVITEFNSSSADFKRVINIGLKV